MIIKEEIEKEKKIVRMVCLGSVHPDQNNQEEFTKWLQDVVIFHLNNLERRCTHDSSDYIIGI